MQNYSSSLYTILSVSLLALLIFSPAIASAHVGIPTQLVPCGVKGGGSASHPCEVCDLYSLAHNIIDLALWGLATPLLVVALLVAGLYWLTSAGSEEKITRGKEILKSAVIGFIIAFGAWIIINTIMDTLSFKNPFYGTAWTDTNFCANSPIRSDAKVPPTTGTGPTGSTGTLPTGTLSNTQATQLLNSAGISVDSTSHCTGNTLGCTTLDGIPAASVDKLIQVKTACGCSFVVGGATETAGHGVNTDHGPGKSAYDLWANGGTTYAQLENAFKGQAAFYQCEYKSIAVSCSQTSIDHIHVRF